MRGRPLLVVGDVLLDRDLDGVAERLARDGPSLVVDDPEEHRRPGGAGLAARLAASVRCPVVLITALSQDEAGAWLRDSLTAVGVEVIDLTLAGPTPEKARIRSGGRVLLRLDRGSRRPAPAGAAGGRALEAMAGAAAVLVSDYGGGVLCSPGLREALTDTAERLPVVWDPHPRGRPPVAGTLLVTPNVHEASHFCGEAAGQDSATLVAQGRLLAARWRAAAVAITRGDRGALLVAAGGSVVNVPATPVAGDCCGAGDSFASAAALELAAGAPVDSAVTAAVRAAGRFVAGGGVSRLRARPVEPAAVWSASPPAIAAQAPAGERLSNASGCAVATRVRAEGGTVVATGGCFDVLHAGHVSILQAARALGDCLVVCLNSDASVRALKGGRRPVVPEEDRAAVLGSLSCVDEVIVFDERTPEALLDRLRPDIWAKGGDYAVDELPEAELIRSWGGQVITLPYLPGRSTTRLLERAGRGVG